MGILKHLQTRKKILPFTTAIIPAAGTGSRMGETCPCGKQLLELGSLPVIIHTLMAFEDCRAINEIIVVTREEEIVPVSDFVKAEGFTKVKLIIKGGKTRQESVFIGVSQCDVKTEYVVIHDGARPFIESETIQKAVEAAEIHGAAAVGTKVKDTMKRVDTAGFISKTVDRSGLWAVQTPQVFRYLEYNMAIAAAKAGGKDYTDDCQLFESIGKRVYMVEGSYNNLKLTTPEDVSYAEYLLLSKGE